MGIPPEIWSLVAYYACTDGGSTARALAQVSRSFALASRPHRFRSLLVKGCYQLVHCVRQLEDLPETSRRVEHLYLAIPDDLDPDEERASLKELYKPDICDRTPGPDPDNFLKSAEDELCWNAIARLLKAVSSSVITVHIQVFYRDFIFFSVEMPKLQELTLEGYHLPGSFDGYNKDLPVLPALRRLKLTHVSFSQESDEPDSVVPTVTSIAPQLSHLFIQYDVPHVASTRHNLQAWLDPESRYYIPTLSALLLAPGAGDPPCGRDASPMQIRKRHFQIGQFALSQPKVVLLPRRRKEADETDAQDELDDVVEGEWDWLNRVQGGPGTWDDSQKLVSIKDVFRQKSRQRRHLDCTF